MGLAGGVLAVAPEDRAVLVREALEAAFDGLRPRRADLMPAATAGRANIAADQRSICG